MPASGGCRGTGVARRRCGTGGMGKRGAAGERRRDVHDGGAFPSSRWRAVWAGVGHARHKALACYVARYGCTRINTAESYNNLGSVYCEQEEALEAHRKVLEIKLKMAGSEHPNIATITWDENPPPGTSRSIPTSPRRIVAWGLFTTVRASTRRP